MDNVAVCRPRTCSISQSDLQRRERDEPAEFKGVRISVRKCRAGVCLVVTENVAHGGKRKNATFHTRDTVCGT